MQRFLVILLTACCTAFAAHAQTAVTLPYAAQAVADIGNGPIKVRVTQGSASIFTSQGSGAGSTSGSSTALTLTAAPTTPPIVGALISGAGITSGTTVAAYNGTTGITLSAAMTVPASTTVSWGAACPSSAAGIPSQYIQASVMADYYLLYTQARVCAISPGGANNALLILPIFYDQTSVAGGGVTSWNGRTGAVTPQVGDYNFNQLSGSVAIGQIPNSLITYAKLQNEAATTLLCNPTGSPAAPSECTLVSGSLRFSATTLDLVPTAVTPASYGSATQCASFTVDQYGRLTAASDATCTPAFSSLTGSASVGQIGASAASHAVPIDVAGTSTWKVVPDCQNSGNNHLNFTQSTDTFSCGTNGTGTSAPGTVLVQNTGAGYTATAPNGSTISCTPANTSCFQEGINYAQTNNTNFRAVCSTNGGTTPLQFTVGLTIGPATGLQYDFVGCSIKCTAAVSTPCITVDTIDQATTINWKTGYIQDAGTGTSVLYFHPHTISPIGNKYVQGVEVHFPYMQALAGKSTGIVRFDATATGYGFANWNKFYFLFEDGTGGNYYASSCIYVDTPPAAANTFAQNVIDFGSCQNIASIGLYIGQVAPTGVLGTNIWHGMIGTATTVTYGVYSWGILDQFQLSNISVNASVLNTGLFFNVGANHNYIIAPQVQGTTDIADAGTGNCGVVNAKQKSCGASW